MDHPWYNIEPKRAYGGVAGKIIVYFYRCGAEWECQESTEESLGEGSEKKETVLAAYQEEMGIE